MPRTHRPYPPEFRAEAVRLARGGEESLPALAADLETSRLTVHETLKRRIAEGVAGLDDKSSAPQQPAPKGHFAGDRDD